MTSAEETPEPQKAPEAQKDFAELNASLAKPVKYATFNSRMLAAIVDAGLVLAIAYPLGATIDGWIFPPLDYSGLQPLASPDVPQEHKSQIMMQFMTEQQLLARMMFTNGFQLLLFALYIIPCWMRYNTTPGKMLVGIEIRDEYTNELMTHRQMIKRFFGYIISGIPLTLGFVWMIFTKKKQCWHDRMAGTVVVVKERRPFSLNLRSASQ